MLSSNKGTEGVAPTGADGADVLDATPIPTLIPTPNQHQYINGGDKFCRS